MNSTRQEIIKIIEPYMDKTLSFGCLVVPNYWDGEVIRIDDNQRTKFEKWKPYLKNPNYECQWERIETRWVEINKIIGHYTISWLLLYVKSIGWNVTMVVDKLEFRQYHNWTWLVAWSFPNKPLINYSVEEERQLLSFLKEIWPHTK